MSDSSTGKDTLWITGQVGKIPTLEALEKFIGQNKEVFSYDKAPDYYLKCLEKNGITTKELYKNITSVKIDGKALINRTYISHFLGATKTLSRDNLFILALFAKMNVDEVNNLLKYANSRGFYDKDRRDKHLKFIFEHVNDPDYPTTADLYKGAEDFLADANERPLCNKLPWTPPALPVGYIPPKEEETIFIGKGLGEIATTEELYAVLNDNPNSITSEEVSKYQRVSAFILDCVSESGLTPTDFIKKINDSEEGAGYIMELSSLYHLFNINNNSRIIKGFTRNNIIAFGIIGGLDLKQINRALKLNNDQPLYARNLRDLYLMFFIQKNYEYNDIEEQLLRKGFSLLNKKYIIEYYGHEIKSAVIASNNTSLLRSTAEYFNIQLSEIKKTPLDTLLKFKPFKDAFEAEAEQQFKEEE